MTPSICQFDGVGIYLYEADHRLTHFHALYVEYAASFDMNTGEVIKGMLPPAKERKVRKWAKKHRGELLENWRRKLVHEDLLDIEP